jgi:site-specific DNA-methyltransferase (adenine-specific)
MLTITNEDNMVMMSRYPDKYFDLAIVDPPYGIGEASGKNHSRGSICKPKLYDIKQWDESTPEQVYFNELFRVSKNQIIWGGNYFLDKINKPTSCFIVWDKDNGKNDFADCELAWTSFKTAVRKYKFKWAGMLQGDMKNKEHRIHPTQKPVALYKWLLENYTNNKDAKILDTHLGSGSIAIACHDYMYDLTACELDIYYYENAIKRIKNHMSQTKILF